LHTAFLGLAVAIPVLWRLDSPMFGSDQDSYFINGYLCIIVAMLLRGGNMVPRAERKIVRFGWIERYWGGLGTGLFAATLVLWIVLFGANIAAYRQASIVSRGLFKATNDLADSNPEFQTLAVPNLPRFYLGVTCGAVPSYLKYPFRPHASSITMSHTPERVIYAVVSNPGNIELIERETFLKRAAVIRSISGKNGMTMIPAGDLAVRLRFTEPLQATAGQFVYIRFRTQIKDLNHLWNAHLFWTSGGRPLDPLKAEMQIVLGGPKAGYPCEVLFELDRNPLYTREAAIEEFYLQWKNYTNVIAGPIDLEVDEAMVLEYPARENTIGAAK
jgi:hypothetical protein